jgi:hypothetical protein
MKAGMIAYFRVMHAHTKPEHDFEPGIRPERPEQSPHSTPRDPANDPPPQIPGKIPDGLPTPDVYPAGWAR